MRNLTRAGLLLLLPISTQAQNPSAEEDIALSLSMMEIQDAVTAEVVNGHASLNRTFALMILCGERNPNAILSQKIAEQTADTTEKLSSRAKAVEAFGALSFSEQLRLLSMMGKSVEISIRAYRAGYLDSAAVLLGDDSSEENVSQQMACEIGDSLALDLLAE